VREIHREEAMMTPDICATPYPVPESTPYPDFLVSAEHPVEMIDGFQFLHGSPAMLRQAIGLALTCTADFTRKDALS
jgi:hypothetical protein